MEMLVLLFKKKKKKVFNIFQLHFDPNEFTGKKKNSGHSFA